jgi:hypothetical protein
MGRVLRARRPPGAPLGRLALEVSLPRLERRDLLRAALGVALPPVCRLLGHGHLVLGCHRCLLVGISGSVRPMGEDGQEVTDAAIAGKRLGERQVCGDRVVVSSPAALAQDVPGFDELADDPMSAPLGHAHSLTDVAHSNARIVGNADEHLAMAAEERPGRGLGLGRRKTLDIGF